MVVDAPHPNVCHARDGVEVGVNMQDSQTPCFGCGGDEKVDDGRALVLADVDKRVRGSPHESPSVVWRRMPAEQAP